MLVKAAAENPLNVKLLTEEAHAKHLLIQVLELLPSLFWPILAALLIWKLLPVIRAIVGSRAFSIKIGGMEVTVEEATQQIGSRIDDLQKQVLALREQAGQSGSAVPSAASVEQSFEALDQTATSRGKLVVWVDDKPNGNAFEIAHLKSLGIEVKTCVETAEALEYIHNNSSVGAVISDMGRAEATGYRGKAGLELLQQLRSAGFDLPFLVYTTAEYAGRTNKMIFEAGGSGATSSQIELLDWIRTHLVG